MADVRGCYSPTGIAHGNAGKSAFIALQLFDSNLYRALGLRVFESVGKQVEQNGIQFFCVKPPHNGRFKRDHGKMQLLFLGEWFEIVLTDMVDKRH